MRDLKNVEGHLFFSKLAMGQVLMIARQKGCSQTGTRKGREPLETEPWFIELQRKDTEGASAWGHEMSVVRRWRAHTIWMLSVPVLMGSKLKPFLSEGWPTLPPSEKKRFRKEGSERCGRVFIFYKIGHGGDSDGCEMERFLTNGNAKDREPSGTETTLRNTGCHPPPMNQQRARSANCE